MGMMIRPGQRLIIPGAQVYQPRAAAGGSFSGVLDGISNVAAAYSLRKLRSAYSGYAVRVRRSSDSTEQDIGFDGSGNFDNSSFSSFVGAGTGYVRTWYDQSGNSADVTQTNTIYQPQIALSAINGKPTILSQSSNSGGFQTAFVQPIGLWLSVANNNGSPNFADFNGLASLEIGGGTQIIHAGQSGTTTLYSAQSAVDTHYSNGIISSEYAPLSSYKISSATNASPATPTNLYVIRWRNNNTRYWNGNCAEQIFLSQNSITSHNTIGNDMATYYGLSWTTVT